MESRDSAGSPVTPRGFRPTSRRRARLAVGAVVAAIGIGGNVLLYTSLDDSIEVVQAVSTIRQGEQIQRSDLRVVEVDLDDTVPVVPADGIDQLVGQYARTFVAAGTLLVDVMVQPMPLVTPGQGVVAVEIRPTRVPRDLRERSQVFIVVVPDDDEAPLFVTEARVVSRSDTSGDGASGDVLSLSVEVTQADGPIIAAANDVRVVLLAPGVDPVTEASASATPTPSPSTTEPDGVG
jgi:hypothetical protein